MTALLSIVPFALGGGLALASLADNLPRLAEDARALRAQITARAA